MNNAKRLQALRKVAMNKKQRNARVLMGLAHLLRQGNQCASVDDWLQGFSLPKNWQAKKWLSKSQPMQALNTLHEIRWGLRELIGIYKNGKYSLYGWLYRYKHFLQNDPACPYESALELWHDCFIQGLPAAFKNQLNELSLSNAETLMQQLTEAFNKWASELSAFQIDLEALIEEVQKTIKQE